MWGSNDWVAHAYVNTEALEDTSVKQTDNRKSMSSERRPGGTGRWLRYLKLELVADVLAGSFP